MPSTPVRTLRPSPTVPARALSRAAPPGALLAALLLGACGDDGATLGTASVDEELPPTTVPGAPVAGVLPATLPPLALDIASTDEYASEDYARIVTEITIPDLSLSVAPGSEDADEDRLEDGMDDDLSFLSSIELFIAATIDGVERTERLGGIPGNDPRLDPDVAARTVELDMTRVDILDFVEAPGGYAVRIEVGGVAPPDDVTFDGDVTYRVGLGLR